MDHSSLARFSFDKLWSSLSRSKLRKSATGKSHCGKHLRNCRSPRRHPHKWPRSQFLRHRVSETLHCNFWNNPTEHSSRRRSVRRKKAGLSMSISGISLAFSMSRNQPELAQFRLDSPASGNDMFCALTKRSNGLPHVRSSPGKPEPAGEGSLIPTTFSI